MDLKSILHDASAQRTAPQPPPLLHASPSPYNHRAAEHVTLDESRLHRPPVQPPPIQTLDAPAPTGGGYFGAQSPRQTTLNSASPHASTPGAGPHSTHTRSPGPQHQLYTPRETAEGHLSLNTTFVPSPSASIQPPSTPGATHPYATAVTPIHPHLPQSHTYSQSPPPPRASQPPNGIVPPQARQISPHAPAQLQPQHPSQHQHQQHSQHIQQQQQQQHHHHHHHHHHHQQQQQQQHYLHHQHQHPQPQPQPQSQQHHQPATPLGPPVAYPRVSPHAQRPPSQGYDQYRRLSHDSAGSAPGRAHIPAPLSQPHALRHDSSDRSSQPDFRERDKSVSVSPKTIPQPSPYHMTSSRHVTPAQRMSVPPTSVPPPSVSRQASISVPTDRIGGTPGPSPPRPSPAPTEPRVLAGSLASGQSLSPAVKQEHEHASVKHETPSVAAASPSAIHKTPPFMAPHPGLKRTASLLDDSSSPQQPRKRLRRHEIPLFAQSARNKPPKFGKGRRGDAVVPAPAPPQPAPRSTSLTAANGVPPAPVPVPAPSPSPGLAGPPNGGGVQWEPSIINKKPMDDLVKEVCDWIYLNIGRYEQPTGGAVFEIEAKIGEIHDVNSGTRLRLPVRNEAIFDSEGWQRTKFETPMVMEQHRKLNQWLNSLVTDRRKDIERGAQLEEILYDHPQQQDEFFELTPEGRKNINPSVTRFLHPRHTPRVRRSVDEKSGQVIAQIIKSRIADLDIYNPNAQFDYRISISIESPWEGDPSWLVPMATDQAKGRHKDRLSYRHLAYQIDLTQVVREDGTESYELEVEVSTQFLRMELENAKAQRANRYMDLVEGLVDNVRLLCKHASVRS